MQNNKNKLVHLNISPLDLTKVVKDQEGDFERQNYGGGRHQDGQVARDRAGGSPALSYNSEEVEGRDETELEFHDFDYEDAGDQHGEGPTGDEFLQ